jgi:hypothetical protein
MGEVVEWRLFFSGDFSGKRTADPERLTPTYYISIDAVSTNDMPYGGSHRYVSSHRGSYPQDPSFFGRQWEFPA